MTSSKNFCARLAADLELGEDAAGLLRRVVSVPEGEIVLGPTGKVRKFLMRQRPAAAAG